MDAQKMAAHQQLQKQIADRDAAIAKLFAWKESQKLVKGSIMISANNDVHQLINWNQALPIPETHLREFIESYLKFLIEQRNQLFTEATELSMQNDNEK